MICWASSSDNDPGLTLRPTVRYPVAWSLLSAEAPSGVSGLMTEATLGCLARSAAASLTALEYLESVSLPLLACSTIGLVPLACVGNDPLRMSVARWLLVPGSDRLSFVLSPICLETTTSATATTSQTASTMNFRRTQNRAIPYRTPLMARFPPSVRRSPQASHADVPRALGRSLAKSL